MIIMGCITHTWELSQIVNGCEGHIVFRYLAGDMSGSNDHHDRYRPSLFTGTVEGCGDARRATPGDNATCGSVGCPQEGQWATGKFAAGVGCMLEVLGGIALSGRATVALTERLPLELIEVRLKAGGGCFCVVQPLLATCGILTARRCGLLAQLVEGTVCAGDRSCADRSL